MALAAAAALAALAAAGYVALPNEGRTLQAVPSSAVTSSALAAPAKALDSVPCVTAIALTGSPNLPVLEAQLAQYGLADRYYPQVMEPDPDGKVAGIFTSHVIAYNRALSRGCTSLLVFEEDGRLNGQALAQSGPRVNNFIRSSKGDFDIVLLGYATNIIGALITGLAKGTLHHVETFKTSVSPAAAECIYHINNWFDTHAYVISADAMRLLKDTKYVVNVTLPIDNYLSTTLQSRAKTYTVRPSVAFQVLDTGRKAAPTVQTIFNASRATRFNSSDLARDGFANGYGGRNAPGVGAEAATNCGGVAHPCGPSPDGSGGLAPGLLQAGHMMDTMTDTPAIWYGHTEPAIYYYSNVSSPAACLPHKAELLRAFNTSGFDSYRIDQPATATQPAAPVDLASDHPAPPTTASHATTTSSTSAAAAATTTTTTTVATTLDTDAPQPQPRRRHNKAQLIWRAFTDYVAHAHKSGPDAHLPSANSDDDSPTPSPSPRPHPATDIGDARNWPAPPGYDDPLLELQSVELQAGRPDAAPAPSSTELLPPHRARWSDLQERGRGEFIRIVPGSADDLQALRKVVPGAEVDLLESAVSRADPEADDLWSDARLQAARAARAVEVRAAATREAQTPRSGGPRATEETSATWLDAIFMR